MASPEEARATMINNLPAKTGKSLAQWLEIIAAAGLRRHGEIVQQLKQDHGLTHGFANLIAHEALNAGVDSGKDPEVLIAAQYAGPKSGLRPIYDTFIGVVQRLGDDVEVAPKKTYVSIRRQRQFALIQASTVSRVDIGIRLDEVAATDRLELAGSFSAMVSHRVRVEDAIEVDSELKAWLKQAYDQAG